MSKSLKKLIDINRLREFKNKLVGTGSAYVQTTAVDQTIAGTKTFSKPIVGSVIGSSGSCTGNAASASSVPWSGVTGKPSTFTPSSHTHDDRYYTENEVNNLLNGKANTSGTYSNLTVGNAGSATNATYANWLRTASHPDYLFRTEWDGAYFWTHVTDPAGSYVAVRVARSDSAATAEACTGNAATATKATQDAAGNTITTTYATKAENNTKANDSDVVHKSGDETIAGTKTFSKPIVGSVTGSSGSCTGNAATATNATYANWLRTSSHSDHLFHTEWDNVGYFWTYVTTGNGDYRAVRVARSDSSGNADTATKASSIISNSDVYHDIRFDWSRQVSGHVGIRVDATDLGGIVTTNNSPAVIRAQWYAAYPDGPEAHNAMWGGRDITAAFNNGTVSANIANGTFHDIFPGDYITKQVTIPRAFADDNVTVLYAGGTYTVNWVVADCDYWINKGDTAMTAHHVAIVPQAPIFDARMNPANSTADGYAGSDMYRKIIPACARGIVHAFGSDHILTFRDAISNSVDVSHVSSGMPQFVGTPGWFGEWVSVNCNLMSEKMVYGAPVCAAGAMDNTMATRQMSAFRLSERLINYNRTTWWLRDVVSSVFFAEVHGIGYVDTYYASGSSGVRPFALLK